MFYEAFFKQRFVKSLCQKTRIKYLSNKTLASKQSNLCGNKVQKTDLFGFWDTIYKLFQANSKILIYFSFYTRNCLRKKGTFEKMLDFWHNWNQQLF